MTVPPRREHIDVLSNLVEAAGRDVADIGCGDGWMTRALTRLGARAVGIECAAKALTRARAAAPEGEERYLVARGESLPLADRSLDIVVFFNSLHHVPEPHIGHALEEAARVLRPGGLIYVAEPLAEGLFFELVRSVDDETAIRAAAYRAIGQAVRPPRRAVSETVYLTPVRLADFAHLRQRIVGADPERGPQFDTIAEELQAEFLRTASLEDGRYVFDQPMRVNLLQMGTANAG